MTLPPDLLILDVGQGNCTLLRNTEGTIVIDCPSGTTLIETIEELKIQEISHLLISHADEDHIGGISTLLRSKQVIVQNVHINSEFNRKTKAWEDLLSSLSDAKERYGLKIFAQLTTSTTDLLQTGDVEITVLAPNSVLALKGGAGSVDNSGNRLNSNSMSAVVAFSHNEHRVAIAAGDLDEVGLHNLLQENTNLEADILIFPHHGGNPSRKNNGSEFTERLCNLVKPKLVIFSNGRGHYGHPFKEIVDTVIKTIPNVHILCTQLSRSCSQTDLTDVSDHLHSLPAKGKATKTCCGGTLAVEINGKKTTYTPGAKIHKNFINAKVATPLCSAILTKQASANDIGTDS
ncbi:MBL fold metallo-hydrolase [Pseudanabaena sp. UWO311]|uniref:ComEC/Rec2 family competence protein n=1 Tax=Pseudanabaena sp. UWO311 TaxID=2487337 RepID=UPI00115A31AF|nr:MBL fold metallo-hydrolase [Pseudanabaena sp. UWO311]TYQ25070.1 MBL fold metallo-hydrolase [Pseudanabaena sp. UWO311]